jgi:hypothetical protein
VHLKSGLIRDVAFGEIGFIRGGLLYYYYLNFGGGQEEFKDTSIYINIRRLFTNVFMFISFVLVFIIVFVQ